LKNKFFTLFFIFWSFNTYSLEIFCNFEEVYVDGSSQQGFFLIKNNALRYEYNNLALYTIFKNDGDFYIVENKDLSKFRKITDNTLILEELINLSQIYPNISDNYIIDDKEISLFKSEEIDFLKRISIKSDSLNMSIYFNNCEFKKIDGSLLRHRPVRKYYR